MGVCMTQLPLSASEIFVEWYKSECGIGVTAFTDGTRLPYIGLYPLDFEDCAAGLPVYFQRSRLMTPLVVGFLSSKPAVLFLDAEVTGRGLNVRLVITSCIEGKLTSRRLWAGWGEAAPKFRVIKS